MLTSDVVSRSLLLYWLTPLLLSVCLLTAEVWRRGAPARRSETSRERPERCEHVHGARRSGGGGGGLIVKCASFLLSSKLEGNGDSSAQWSLQTGSLPVHIQPV